MRREDDSAIRALLSRGRPNVTGVTIVSASNEEVEIAREFWPHAEVRQLSEGQWDLYEEGPLPLDRDWGILIMCNTFLCSRDPKLWLSNISRTHRYVLIQDLAEDERVGDRHLSPETGDFSRYSGSSHGVMGQTDPGHEVHDISTFGYRIIDCLSYGFDNNAGTKFVVILDLHDKWT